MLDVECWMLSETSTDFTPDPSNIQQLTLNIQHLYAGENSPRRYRVIMVTPLCWLSQDREFHFMLCALE